MLAIGLDAAEPTYIEQLLTEGARLLDLPRRSRPEPFRPDGFDLVHG